MWTKRDIPAKATQTWSSSMATLRTVLGSWSCKADFFSTPRTTHDLPRTPTWMLALYWAQAIRAYGTGTSSNCFESVFDLEQLIVSSYIHSRRSELTCPSGEKTVKATISVAHVVLASQSQWRWSSPRSYDLDILYYPLLVDGIGR